MAKQQRPVEAVSPRGGSRLRWLVTRLLLVAALFALLVFIAPLCIGGMGLWKTILAWTAPAVANQISASSIRLSWLSPLEIRGLVVRDPEGQPLAELPHIRSRKSLFSIAASYPDVGI